MGRAGIGVFAPSYRISALTPDVMAETLGFDSDDTLRERLIAEHVNNGESLRAHQARETEHIERETFFENQARAEILISVEYDYERRVWIAFADGEEIASHWKIETVTNAVKKQGLTLWDGR